jgi:spermidine/putrescine transport system substrate-binding protein
VRLGWTEKLPLDEIPNHKNLDEAYLGLAWDEGAKHHMPWQGGLTGIAWNPKLVGGDLHSVDDLYDKKLKGKVSFMTEWRDSIGMTMFTDGADPAKSDIGAMHKAIDKIDKARSDGQILKFTGNEYLRGLENGDLAACLAWSGDIAQLDPELGIKFAIPDEGGMQWFDTMTIPKGSKNRVAAARWMNYVYDPEHAAKITEFVQYVTPVKGVKEVLADAGGDAAELADNPLIFPDDETASRLKVFADLKQKDEADIEKRFSEVSG